MVPPFLWVGTKLRSGATRALGLGLDGFEALARGKKSGRLTRRSAKLGQLGRRCAGPMSSARVVVIAHDTAGKFPIQPGARGELGVERRRPRSPHRLPMHHFWQSSRNALLRARSRRRVRVKRGMEPGWCDADVLLQARRPQHTAGRDNQPACRLTTGLIGRADRSPPTVHRHRAAAGRGLEMPRTARRRVGRQPMHQGVELVVERAAVSTGL